MKVMVCIPMEIECEVYGRKENKEAVKNRLLSEGLETVLKSNLETGFFLVRKPERVPGFTLDGQPEDD